MEAKVNVCTRCRRRRPHTPARAGYVSIRYLFPARKCSLCSLPSHVLLVGVSYLASEGAAAFRVAHLGRKDIHCTRIRSFWPDVDSWPEEQPGRHDTPPQPTARYLLRIPRHGLAKA